MNKEELEETIQRCCKVWWGKDSKNIKLRDNGEYNCEVGSAIAQFLENGETDIKCLCYEGVTEVDGKKVYLCSKVSGYNERFKDVPSQCAQANKE